MYRPSLKRQRGAALVIGLMLLVIVTLLAITAVGTSNTELIMAGNEQFRERATQAADAGIEAAIRTLRTDVPPGSGAKDYANIALPSLTGDTYTTRSEYLGYSTISYNGSAFTTFVYRVRSTGASLRNSTAVHEVGAWELGPKDSSNFPPMPGGSDL